MDLGERRSARCFRVPQWAEAAQFPDVQEECAPAPEKAAALVFRLGFWGARLAVWVHSSAVSLSRQETMREGPPSSLARSWVEGVFRDLAME
jgi:hypothetical protein